MTLNTMGCHMIQIVFGLINMTANKKYQKERAGTNTPKIAKLVVEGWLVLNTTYPKQRYSHKERLQLI